MPPENLRHAVTAALGRPAASPRLPDGYKDLQPDGVNDYVLRNLQIADTIVEEFNNSSKPFFQGSLPALSCMGTWHRAGHNKFCVG